MCNIVNDLAQVMYEDALYSTNVVCIETRMNENMVFVLFLVLCLKRMLFPRVILNEMEL